MATNYQEAPQPPPKNGESYTITAVNTESVSNTNWLRLSPLFPLFLTLIFAIVGTATGEWIKARAGGRKVKIGFYDVCTLGDCTSRQDFCDIFDETPVICQRLLGGAVLLPFAVVSSFVSLVTYGIFYRKSTPVWANTTLGVAIFTVIVELIAVILGGVAKDDMSEFRDVSKVELGTSFAVTVVGLLFGVMSVGAVWYGKGLKQ